MLTKLDLRCNKAHVHDSQKLPKQVVPPREKVGISSAAVHSSPTSWHNDTVKKMVYAMPYVAKEQSEAFCEIACVNTDLALP